MPAPRALSRIQIRRAVGIGVEKSLLAALRIPRDFRFRPDTQPLSRGVEAQVPFAGLVPGATNGLHQINLLLAAETPIGDAVPLGVSVDDFQIQGGVTLAVAAGH